MHVNLFIPHMYTFMNTRDTIKEVKPPSAVRTVRKETLFWMFWPVGGWESDEVMSFCCVVLLEVANQPWQMER